MSKLILLVRYLEDTRMREQKGYQNEARKSHTWLPVVANAILITKRSFTNSHTH